MTNVLITTTPTVENCPVREYLGIVSGMALMRRWWLYQEVSEDLAAKDWADFKAELHKAQDWAIQQMAKKAERLGANAVIGVKIDYKTGK
jgi:uncharacterized protein YbjQ (UPF0145 family)